MDKQEFDKNLPILALIAASILGLYIRLNPILQTDFPLNDGGLFVMMTEELLEADFQLPVFTNYNFSQIPYAYPPLGFYLAAFLTWITKLDVITLFRFLPAVISWLTIPIVFLTAKKLLKSPLSVSLAVIIYALLPRSWMWLIMGGGLTRTLGMLFSILMIYFAYDLFTQQKKLIPTILCFTLTALSHPEAIIFSALNLGLLFLIFNRSKTGLLYLALVSFGGLVATAPWWGMILIRHGLEPFLSAGQTSGWTFLSIFRLLRDELTGEPNPAVIASLGILGLFYSLAKKENFLPISAILTLIIIPRSGPNLLSFPLALLAAQALSEVVLPGISRVVEKFQAAGKKLPDQFPTISKVLLGYLCLQLLFAGVYVINEPETPLHSISSEAHEAMKWISEYTPPESKFLVVSNVFWWEDHTGEWFPYLTRRQALNTLQGSEWLPEEEFNILLTWNTLAQDSLDQPIEFFKQNQAEFNIPFTHIYVVRDTETTPLPNTRAFELELRQDQDFELIFEGPAGVVFAWQP
jgi:hypothetical protein